MTENMNLYRYRFLSRLLIELKTPLAIGSGGKDVLTDRTVTKDANGLPYIPGTAIAGIIRHTIETKRGKDSVKTLFGYQENKNGQGSEIIFSSAQIVDEDGRIVESLYNPKSEYLKQFENLPIRQHVCINEKGTAEKRGKFDEEIVYKGTRFCFEIEMISKDGKNIDLFDNILSENASETLRIGSGTRKGFGEVLIIECRKKSIDLTHADDLNAYINKTSSLNDLFWENIKNEIPDVAADGNWITYQLELQPDDFFFFGSGFGNDNADMTPISETYFDWSSGKPVPKRKTILIPGSSVKGALSHRTAFHYNKIKKYFAGNENAKVGGENAAVRNLFGYTSQDEKEQMRGNVLISDVIQEMQGEQFKILNHVAIDRFTGGTIDGALFTEEVTYGKGKIYTLSLKVNASALNDNDIINAFEAALIDISTGMLPLGGGVNRGHGCFNGIVSKNGKEIGGLENAN